MCQRTILGGVKKIFPKKFLHKKILGVEYFGSNFGLKNPNQREFWDQKSLGLIDLGPKRGAATG